ncbi:MAG: M48 family metallopeptidase [Sphingosinicella sp.]|uniref:M48 family metallopeptidase n=1 Tax=Sphingosinicella sp. TaxID=1917971 RepID=UPI0040378827
MKRAISNIISSIVSSELSLGGVPVTIRVSPRAQRLRLKVDPRTRAVLLTVPRRVSRRRALAWAAEHQLWVEKTLADIPAGTPLVPGGTIPFRGTPHRIDWEPARPRRIERNGVNLRTGGPIEGLEARLLRWLKSEALILLREETREFAAKAGVMASKVGVGDPVSRWGSCSSAGTVRFSWRLILAPDFVRRATVAHEVAHLVHMHHGPDFHALVQQLLGVDPGPARLWLRREGASLHRLGAQ